MASNFKEGFGLGRKISGGIISYFDNMETSRPVEGLSHSDWNDLKKRIEKAQYRIINEMDFRRDIAWEGLKWELLDRVDNRPSDEVLEQIRGGIMPYLDRVIYLSETDTSELTNKNKIRAVRYISRIEKILDDDDKILLFIQNLMGLIGYMLNKVPQTTNQKGEPVLLIDGESAFPDKIKFIAGYYGILKDIHQNTDGLFLRDVAELIKQHSPEEIAEHFKDTPFPIALTRLTPFGESTFDFFNHKGSYHIPFNRRFQHMHVMARSGHGKTQLLQNFIFNDIMKAHDNKLGLCVIDGQGDLFNNIKHLKALAPLQDKVIILDPSDTEYPFALNPFSVLQDGKENLTEIQKEEIYNDTIDLLEFVFSSLLGASLTAKQRVIFRFIVRLLVSIEGATMKTMQELLEDSAPFQPYIEKLDSISRSFFLNQFDEAIYSDTKQQVLARLYGILTTPAIAKIFSAKNNKLDMYEAMNTGSIVLVNTDKSLLKKDGHGLLGKYVIALIMQGVLKRKYIDPDKRTPFFVYADEAQDYIDEKTEEFLTQARKYKVGLILAHQYLDQLSAVMTSAINVNTGIKLIGSTGAKDRRAMGQELEIEIEQFSDLKSIDRVGADYLLKTPDSPTLKVFVPFGILESTGRMSNETLAYIIAKNREKYTDKGTAQTTQTDHNQTKEKPQEAEPSSGFNPDEIEDL